MASVSGKMATLRIVENSSINITYLKGSYVKGTLDEMLQRKKKAQKLVQQTHKNNTTMKTPASLTIVMKAINENKDTPNYN